MINAETVQSADSLMQFKRSDLYKAGRLNGVSFGRNPTHQEIAETLAARASQGAMAEAISNTLNDVVSDKGDQGPKPETEREPEPKPKGNGNGNGDADGLYGFASMFDQAVKSAVKAEMDKLRSELPDQTPQIKVQINEQEIKELPEGTVVPESFERICTLVRARMPVLLVGPSGCGKTHCAEQVAKAMNMRYLPLSFTEGVREQDLTGHLLPTGEGGRFEYHASDFVEAIQHKGPDQDDEYDGYLVLLDDVDRADPNMLAILHSALANGYISIPHKVDGNGKIVYVKKGFAVIATANSWGHGSQTYVDANALGAAFLDRFRIGQIHMDYSERIEKQIVDAEVLQWGQSLRKRIAESGIERIVSTRFLRYATVMMQGYGWQLDDAKQAFYADWTDEEKKRINQ